MARKNRVQVSSYERRRWLEDLERGRGITEIANIAGRDIRVVKRHIATAEQEREVGRARSELLWGRLEQHQEDLLSQVRCFRDVARVMNPGSLTEFKAEERQHTRLYQALLAHLVRFPVKRLWEAFGSAVADYLEAREVFVGQLRNREQELMAGMPAGTEAFPWHDKIGDMIEAEAWDGKSRRRTYSPPQPKMGPEGELLY